MSIFLTREELYHPALVHLPVAIALIWCLLELTTRLYAKKRREMDFAFLFLAVCGATAAFFSNMTGEMAQNLHKASPETMQLIRHHADVAVYVVWFYLVLTVLAAVIMVAGLEWLRIVRFGIACGLLFVVAVAASRGAALVFEHGIGVKGTVQHGGHD